METPLADKRCAALPPGTPGLAGPQVEELRAQLDPRWAVRSGPRLVRRFPSKDYPLLLRLCTQIGLLAQSQDHHPDLQLSFGVLEVSTWTHTVGGLSRNDFILAAGIDRLSQGTSF